GHSVQAPTVFPLVQCGSGTGEVTIGCMATGFTPASLTFKWEFGGSELADAVQYPTAKKDNQYTGVSQIRVRRQDWDTRKPFTCSAVHAGGTAKAERLPLVRYMLVQPFQMVSFGCFAADFSPKDYTITWLRNGKKIDPSESSTSSEGKKNETGTFYNAASYIQVKENHWKDDGTNITCRFANGKEPVDAHLTYGGGCDEPSTKLEIDILPISLETMYLENNADLVCKVHSSDPVEVKWFNESGEVLSVLESPSSNTYIARTKITYDEWSKGMKWFCEASIKDSIEVPTRKYFVKNNGEVPPSVYLLPPVDDLSCTNMTLTCFVKDFYPADILVHWLVDNLTIDGNALYSHKTTNVIENGDLFSTYGQLTFSSDGWKDGRVFRCEVYHMSMDSKNQPIVKLITENTHPSQKTKTPHFRLFTCF
uniref:Ig-like domain-containing protein n=1 Tax=Gadus morhua TaxID=8049 RepID=A0A8C5AE75_GADMO